jgi:hypothetical protein
VYPQLPVVQEGAALAQSLGHTVPQVPQLFTSLAVFVSHPLRLAFSLALQSA